ncbi:MAG: hypothetical protein FVQ84_04455 [Planctomycetes bacterium]|nr:hypothetical protein [Planctomycetota bacterium]
MNRVLRPKCKCQLLLILIFILGFALRLYHIDFQDIWRDEAASINAALQPAQMIVDISINDTNPPLHQLLLNLWMKVFGKSAISVRMLSLTFGMLTIYFTYLLSTLIFSNATYRLLTALFASINPLLIVYSQEARAYSMLVTFAVATIYFACRMNRNARLDVYLYFILFSLLGLYTHNIFTVVMAAIMIALFIGILYSALHHKKNGLAFQHCDFKYAALSYICISICYLPWFIIMVQQYGKVVSSDFWLPFHPIKGLIENYGWFFTSRHYNSSLTVLDWFAYGFIRLFAIWLSIGGIILELGNSTRSLLKLSLLVLLMLGIVFLISFKTPFYYVRYMIFVVPILLTLLSYGIRDFLTLFGRKSAIILTAIFITSNLVFYLNNIAQNAFKAEYQKALKYIEFDPATDIILHPHASTFHSFKYYSDFPSYIYNPNRDIPYYEGLAYISGGDYYDGHLAKYMRLWIMNLGKDGRFERDLTRHGFIKVKKKHFGRRLFVDLWLLKQPAGLFGHSRKLDSPVFYDP